MRGNARRSTAVGRVFELREFFEWRGLGSIDHSGRAAHASYARFDAERKFSVPALKIADPKSCQCGEVLKGVIKPWQCKVFGTACTPETPLGALMVSSEGACAAYYQYGGSELARLIACARRAKRAEPVLTRAPPQPRIRRRSGRLRDRRHAGARRRRQGDARPDRRRLRRQLRQRGARPARGPGPPGLAELVARGDRLAFTTDSYVVDPLFFPGGDIGKLAVIGTVNDLAVGGARPLYLCCSVIIEEGFERRHSAPGRRLRWRRRRARRACRS